MVCLCFFPCFLYFSTTVFLSFAQIFYKYLLFPLLSELAPCTSYNIFPQFRTQIWFEFSLITLSTKSQPYSSCPQFLSLSFPMFHSTSHTQRTPTQSGQTLFRSMKLMCQLQILSIFFLDKHIFPKNEMGKHRVVMCLEEEDSSCRRMSA